ncbi:MAG TPA: helix-hairpin-helix domain-containing protein [Ktedonobacterales bacterium]|nr:helix-hairpin-helix domain-containing protein [Ktedonobacterales bacterium]
MPASGALEWLARPLRSRAYLPISLSLTVVLLAGTSLDLIVRAGAWPPAFLRPHPAIVITNPGVSVTATIQASVLGAVRSPGVYTLVRGSHVQDLVEAAGGVLTTADLSRVELGAVLADGQSVYVPHSGEQIPVERNGKIDLNAATATQLRDALGITLTTARHIVDYRAAHGRFTAVSQLLLVPVSRTIYDRIKMCSSQSLALRFAVLA